LPLIWAADAAFTVCDRDAGQRGEHRADRLFLGVPLNAEKEAPAPRFDCHGQLIDRPATGSQRCGHLRHSLVVS